MLSACNHTVNTSSVHDKELANWRLAWRVVESEWNEAYEEAELRFDSLAQVQAYPEMDLSALHAGLSVKIELGKEEEVSEILPKLSEEQFAKLCQSEKLMGFSQCEGLAAPKASRPDLEQQLIDIYVKDQYIRGNVLHEWLERSQVDTISLKHQTMGQVDKENREALKSIIEEVGFPTREMVGKVGMSTAFIVIQHADQDTAWQKAQLPNIKQAVLAGDMDGTRYAYLFDRTQVNSGGKQRYGTQFASVDPASGQATLAPVEMPSELDERRMEVGLMPFDMYRRLMLKAPGN